MKQALIVVLATLLLGARDGGAQTKLSPKWEELTAADFRQAIEQSKGTCLLPFGILEKHGPQLPLGTDLLNVRYASLHAAEKEYAVVFEKTANGWSAYAPDLPGLGVAAETIEETEQLLREGIELHIEGLREDGLPIPEPSTRVMQLAVPA